MNNENIVCPVCTLYLRPGITLKAHLGSHPKQKVIEALVRISNNESSKKDLIISQIEENSSSASTSNHGNSSSPFLENPVQNASLPQNFGIIPGNHSFIYHQFMSTSSQQSPPTILNGNPIAPQYITIPTVFNPQMVCSPYLYQQQQVIMSTGPSIPQSHPILPKSVVPDLPISSQSTIEQTVPSSVAPVSSASNTVNFDTYQDRSNFITIDKRPTGEINNSPSLSSGNIIISPVPNSPSATSHTSMSPAHSSESQVEGTKEEDFEVEKNCKNEQESTENDMSNACSNKPPELSTEACEYTLHKEEKLRKNVCEEDEGNVDFTKACQTQQINSVEDISLEKMECYEVQMSPEIQRNLEEIPGTYYASETVITSDQVQVTIPSTYELAEPVFTVSNTTFVDTNEQNTVENLENINIILSSDFVSNQLISRIDDFECINEDDKRVIMNIGCIDSGNQGSIERLGDESMSQESENVSIRADEPMPAKGELSGQESNGGASDTVWGRLQYEGSSRISTSYDLLAQETWEVSNGSYMEIPSVQSRNTGNTPYTSDEIEDTPTVVNVIEAPKNFKCSVCGEAFKCLKERRLHHKEKHKVENKIGKTKELNVVGSKINNKKVKKIIIKPKKPENNFDNVFTNKLKNQDEDAMLDNSGVGVPSSPVKSEENKESKHSPTENPLNCSLCNQEFPNFRSFKCHSMVEHKINFDVKRTCTVCDENFSNELEYLQHLRIHPLECRLCGKYFYRKQNMQLHMKRHLGVRPYKCELCTKSFLTKQKYNEHRNVHTGEAPIKCNLCDESFKRHSNLVQHRNRHHLNIKAKVKDYICFCGEVVHSKKKLAWHKEIHDTKPKACAHCPEKFIHMASLTRHMRRAHNQHYVPVKERSSENVECPICKGVYLRSSLEAHIRSHSGQKPFTCQICNKDFTTKWNLKLHKWTHASRSAKPFKCDQCKGAFIRESEYIAHMNSHKSVRPYTCNHCGAQFIRKYNCQRHVKEHLTGKSFSCTICGKMFHRSYYLNDHMRVHNGLRPFACHICGKTSTTKSNHNKHIRIHHAREPISTEN